MNDTKTAAIAHHTEQAPQFTERYARLGVDPYENCFTYSRHRLDAALGRCLPAAGHGLRLLDVGCGTGHHLARLRTRGFDVAGIDGSDAMVELARAQNPGATIERADVEAIPFESARFDVIVCIEVLRYLPDISRCVREIARVLKPGGVCLVTAMPLLNLNGYWVVNRMVTMLRVTGFVRLKQYFGTSWSLARQFSEAGFERPAIHGVYLGPVNWIERVAPRALPGLLRRWEPIDVRIADRPVLREFSNMFLICARQGRHGT